MESGLIGLLVFAAVVGVAIYFGTRKKSGGSSGGSGGSGGGNSGNPDQEK